VGLAGVDPHQEGLYQDLEVVQRSKGFHRRQSRRNLRIEETESMLHISHNTHNYAYYAYYATLYVRIIRIIMRIMRLCTSPA